MRTSHALDAKLESTLFDELKQVSEHDDLAGKEIEIISEKQIIRKLQGYFDITSIEEKSKIVFPTKRQLSEYKDSHSLMKAFSPAFKFYLAQQTGCEEIPKPISLFLKYWQHLNATQCDIPEDESGNLKCLILYFAEKLNNKLCLAIYSIIRENKSEKDIAKEAINLIEKGADPDSVFIKQPILIYAAENGLAEITQVLLDAKADKEAVDNKGNTALIKAAKNGHINTVKLLLENKANVDTLNHSGYSALMEASENNRTESALALLKFQANPNFKLYYYEDTALDFAVKKRNATLVSALLPVTQREICIELIWLALSPLYCHADTINEFIKYFGIEAINSISHPRDGSFALAYAIRAGKRDVIDLLIRNGVQIDAANPKGNTPLYDAVHLLKYDIVDLLLENKANPYIKNKAGLSPLAHAAKEQSTQLIDIFTIKHECDPFPAMKYAIHKNCITIVNHLLPITNREKLLDFFWNAVSDGKEAAVNTFLEISELNCIELRNNLGNTALITATIHGHINIVSMLIDAGCDIDATSTRSEQRTALSFALRHEYPDIAKLLLGHNADPRLVSDEDFNLALTSQAFDETLLDSIRTPSGCCVVL